MSILKAYTEEGDVIHIDDYCDEYKGKLFCAEGHKVSARRGRKKVHHYAHKSGEGSLYCSKGTGEWHLESQARVENEFLEVRVKGDNKYHIADVLTPEGVVVEFQKSIIPPTIIEEREVFYNKHCKSLVWVIDASKMDIDLDDGKMIILKGSEFWRYTRSPTFLDQGKRGYIEVLDNRKLQYRICSYSEFDERFLSSCLRKDATKRKDRHKY